MKDFDIIDYNHCITNLTSSIEQYFGLKPSYNTLKEADFALSQKEYKNVLVILFDAMGSAIIDKNLKPDNFLINHKVCDFKSCYPPTTACCTTSYRSGKNGCETGWLGWSSYFKEEGITVENFTNKYLKTKEPVGGEYRSAKYLPYTTLGERIEAGNKSVKYYDFSPYSINESYKHLTKVMKEITAICKEPGKKYFYVYFNQPDSTMHDYGTTNCKVKRHLRKIINSLKTFERETEDTLAFISADHGMMDVEQIDFWKEQDLMDMIYAFPSCDARTAFFFIKDGCKEQFAKLFNERFGHVYKLYTKQEVLENKIFGEGFQSPKLNDLVGDFVAITDSNYYFAFSENHPRFKGHHAGIGKDEMTIPLIIINN